MDTRYVQHISGQGEEWLVADETLVSWRIKTPYGSSILLYDFPKSEYVLCEPPVVQWKDVTEACVLDECGAIMHNGVNTFADERYRRRKVCLKTFGHAGGQWLVIIEQKVTE